MSTIDAFFQIIGGLAGNLTFRKKHPIKYNNGSTHIYYYKKDEERHKKFLHKDEIIFDNISMSLNAPPFFLASFSGFSKTDSGTVTKRCIRSVAQQKTS